MFCPKCGAELTPGQRFCTSCGESIPTVVSEPHARQEGFDPAENTTAVVYGPPPAPVPHPTPKPKKLLFVLLAVVIVALVAGLIVLFAHRGSDKAPEASQPTIELPVIEPAPQDQPAPAPVPDPQADPQAELDAAVSAAVDEGYQVFGGTLNIMGTDELCDFQGVDAGMFSAKGEFAVLVFDHETTVDGMSGDGSGLRTQGATMLGVAEYTDYTSFAVDEGDLGMWRAYDGQHLTVAVKAEKIMFPSDVSLPVGEPRTGSARILG